MRAQQIQLNKIEILKEYFVDYSTKWEDEEKEVSENIKNIDVISPVTVFALKNERFALITGRRRFIAAQKMGMSEIPAVVITSEKDAAFYKKIGGLLEKDKIDPNIFFDYSMDFMAEKFNASKDDVVLSIYNFLFVSKINPSKYVEEITQIFNIVDYGKNRIELSAKFENCVKKYCLDRKLVESTDTPKMSKLSSKYFSREEKKKEVLKKIREKAELDARIAAGEEIPNKKITKKSKKEEDEDILSLFSEILKDDYDSKNVDKNAIDDIEEADKKRARRPKLPEELLKKKQETYLDQLLREVNSQMSGDEISTDDVKNILIEEQKRQKESNVMSQYDDVNTSKEAQELLEDFSQTDLLDVVRNFEEQKILSQDGVEIKDTEEKMDIFKFLEMLDELNKKEGYKAIRKLLMDAITTLKTRKTLVNMPDDMYDNLSDPDKERFIEQRKYYLEQITRGEGLEEGADLLMAEVLKKMEKKKTKD
jgi:hypothetical protein